MDQEALYDQFNFPAGDVEWQTGPDGSLIGSTVVSVYVCPSDNYPLVAPIPAYDTIANPVHPGDMVAKTNYAASIGPGHSDYNAWQPGGNCYCQNPFASLQRGDPNNVYTVKGYPGPFNRYGDPCLAAMVTDGLSNTIFFGEVRPGCSDHVAKGWANPNNGNGMVGTAVPINYNTCTQFAARTSSTSPCNMDCNWNVEFGFRSAHLGGANFLFGDGVVRFLNQDIDPFLYQNLGDKADGYATKSP